MYYKLSVDEQPITTTRMTLRDETEPCLNPNELDYFIQDDDYYATERIVRQPTCTSSDTRSYDFESILTEPLYDVNEFMVQRYSGVLDTLEDLPRYSETVPNYLTTKSDNYYNLLTRQTVQHNSG